MSDTPGREECLAFSPYASEPIERNEKETSLKLFVLL